MSITARIERIDSEGDRRSAERHVLRLQASGTMAEAPGQPVIVHDLSLTGLLMETAAELSAGARVEVDLPEAGQTEATVVWTTGRYVGCRFDTPLHASALAAARLKNPIDAPEPPPAPHTKSSKRESQSPRRPSRLQLAALLGLAAWALVLLPLAAL